MAFEISEYQQRKMIDGPNICTRTENLKFQMSHDLKICNGEMLESKSEGITLQMISKRKKKVNNMPFFS